MTLKRLFTSFNDRPFEGRSIRLKPLDVELNLVESDDIPGQWTHICLLFVCGAVGQTKTQVGKHDWAIFLCTDTTLSATDILRRYAMRWAIEVYFKEAKQQLGLLKEQSNHYAAYMASIHLTAIRFYMLVIAKQIQNGTNVAQMRLQFCNNST